MQVTIIISLTITNITQFKIIYSTSVKQGKEIIHPQFLFAFFQYQVNESFYFREANHKTISTPCCGCHLKIMQLHPSFKITSIDLLNLA